MHRLLLLIALAAGVLSPAAGAFGVPASAADDPTGIGVRLVDAPVETRDNPRARVYIIDHVSPGTLIERRIEVTNDSGDTARIDVYPAAAKIENGSFVGLDSDTPNELSTWTSVGSPLVKLDQGASEMVDVTIDVPGDAAPGEQYAVIWAQVSSGAKDGSGVTQVSRVGIRVYLSVGLGGEPPSDFEIEALTPGRDASGHPVVQATIHNTGGRALDLSGTLTLSDGPGGLSAGPFPVTLGTTLAVGTTEPIDVQLDKQLPNGPWKAEISVTSGLLTHDARATITFPDAGTGASVTPEATSPGFPWRLWVGGILLGAVLLAMAMFLLGRRRRRLHILPATHRLTGHVA